jgi:LytS/YehU family sensor histidine kinase
LRYRKSAYPIFASAMKKFFLRNKLIFIGIILGAVGGYLYYHFVGCTAHTCPITSKPVNSILYGALMGGLVFNIAQKEDTKK